MGRPSAEPAPTKDTASVELSGAAERATTAKPEALEPWVGGKDARRLEITPRDDMPLGGPGAQSATAAWRQGRAQAQV
jgi:hypothetical protein